MRKSLIALLCGLLLPNRLDHDLHGSIRRCRGSDGSRHPALHGATWWHSCGKKIELIKRDTAGVPDAAKRLAQELIVNGHVDLLGGFVITPQILAITDLTTEAKKFSVVIPSKRE